MKETKFAVIPDMHIPQHDEVAFKTAMKLISWYKPDEIIVLGDFLDCAPVSHHNRLNLREREGMRMKDDFILGSKKLDIIQDNCNKLTFLEGNHELWLRGAMDESPELEGMLDLEQNLDFLARKINFLPYNNPYHLGKLAFVHGLYSGGNVAKKHVDALGQSVVFGHDHSLAMHVKVSPVDVNDRHLGLSLGCLAKVNPYYMRSKPNNWVHAVGIGLARKNGDFAIDPIAIISGKASYAGKTFG